ncbi:hypothetical protein ACN27E_11965 [Mycobacterium sp. WMMD1722]|uniref:hypothetical protein n=1 Tax=Mycobacterium sp. WMMD1722 TaxID=3404117 RepID=UPI003BF52C68
MTVDPLDRWGGLATAQELLTVMTRQQLDVRVRRGELIRLWHGVYTSEPADLRLRLAGLDMFLGQEAVACMGSAAALYGFDVENTTAVHILDPGRRVRPTLGLMVHQRLGAPIRRISGRLAVTPAWTAVEIARQLPRPRALATLDAAVHSSWCSTAELEKAIHRQKGRRGIVAVRELLPDVNGRAESAMESEARLVMIDHGLPRPELQYEIRGPNGEVWRVDFAWPEQRIIAEYESVEWHAGRADMIRDRKRMAALQQLGWTVIPIVVEDVRRRPTELAQRIEFHLTSARRAG